MNIYLYKQTHDYTYKMAYTKLLRLTHAHENSYENACENTLTKTHVFGWTRIIKLTKLIGFGLEDEWRDLVEREKKEKKYERGETHGNKMEKERKKMRARDRYE